MKMKKAVYIEACIFLVSIILYILGIFLPVVSVRQNAFGEIHVHKKSTYESLKEFYSNDQKIPFYLIFVFSVFLPAIKFLLALRASYTYSFHNKVATIYNKSIPNILRHISKYQFVDIFVVIFMVGTLNGEFLMTRVHSGFYFFLGYCFMSVISSQVLYLSQRSSVVINSRKRKASIFSQQVATFALEFIQLTICTFAFVLGSTIACFYPLVTIRVGDELLLIRNEFSLINIIKNIYQMSVLCFIITIVLIIIFPAMHIISCWLLFYMKHFTHSSYTENLLHIHIHPDELKSSRDEAASGRQNPESQATMAIRSSVSPPRLLSLRLGDARTIDSRSQTTVEKQMSCFTANCDHTEKCASLETPQEERLTGTSNEPNDSLSIQRQGSASTVLLGRAPAVAKDRTADVDQRKIKAASYKNMGKTLEIAIAEKNERRLRIALKIFRDLVADWNFIDVFAIALLTSLFALSAFEFLKAVVPVSHIGLNGFWGLLLAGVANFELSGLIKPVFFEPEEDFEQDEIEEMENDKMLDKVATLLPSQICSPLVSVIVLQYLMARPGGLLALLSDIHEMYTRKNHLQGHPGAVSQMQEHPGVTPQLRTDSYDNPRNSPNYHYWKNLHRMHSLARGKISDPLHWHRSKDSIGADDSLSGKGDRVSIDIKGDKKTEITNKGSLTDCLLPSKEEHIDRINSGQSFDSLGGPDDSKVQDGAASCAVIRFQEQIDFLNKLDSWERNIISVLIENFAIYCSNNNLSTQNMKDSYDTNDLMQFILHPITGQGNGPFESDDRKKDEAKHNLLQRLQHSIPKVEVEGMKKTLPLSENAKVDVHSQVLRKLDQITIEKVNGLLKSTTDADNEIQIQEGSGKEFVIDINDNDSNEDYYSAVQYPPNFEYSPHYSTTSPYFRQNSLSLNKELDSRLLAVSDSHLDALQSVPSFPATVKGVSDHTLRRGVSALEEGICYSAVSENVESCVGGDVAGKKSWSHFDDANSLSGTVLSPLCLGSKLQISPPRSMKYSCERADKSPISLVEEISNVHHSKGHDLQYSRRQIKLEEEENPKVQKHAKFLFLGLFKRPLLVMKIVLTIYFLKKLYESPDIPRASKIDLEIANTTLKKYLPKIESALISAIPNSVGQCVPPTLASDTKLSSMKSLGESRIRSRRDSFSRAMWKGSDQGNDSVFETNEPSKEAPPIKSLEVPLGPCHDSGMLVDDHFFNKNIELNVRWIGGIHSLHIEHLNLVPVANNRMELQGIGVVKDLSINLGVRAFEDNLIDDSKHCCDNDLQVAISVSFQCYPTFPYLRNGELNYMDSTTPGVRANVIGNRPIVYDLTETAKTEVGKILTPHLQLEAEIPYIDGNKYSLEQILNLVVLANLDTPDKIFSCPAAGDLNMANIPVFPPTFVDIDDHDRNTPYVLNGSDINSTIMRLKNVAAKAIKHLAPPTHGECLKRIEGSNLYMKDLTIMKIYLKCFFGLDSLEILNVSFYVAADRKMKLRISGKVGGLRTLVAIKFPWVDPSFSTENCCEKDRAVALELSMTCDSGKITQVELSGIALSPVILNFSMKSVSITGDIISAIKSEIGSLLTEKKIPMPDGSESLVLDALNKGLAQITSNRPVVCPSPTEKEILSLEGEVQKIEQKLYKELEKGDGKEPRDL